MDGEITIGTKLDTDKFDRQISQLEKKMQKEEDKKIEIEAKIKDVSSEKIDKQIQNIKDKIEKTTNAPATLKVNTDIVKMEKELQQYDLAREKAKEYKKQLNELKQKQREMRRANPTLATSRDTGEYKQVKDDIQEISRLLQENNKKILEGEPKIDQVSNSLDRLKEKQSSITNKVLEYKNTLDTLNTQKQQEINNKTEQYKKQLQEINQNVSEYKQKIENVKMQKHVAEIKKLKEGFNNVGSSIQGAVKHVARLALGIFGIRSAFMFLKRASSDLASYDQQYATNLEYIRYALTQMIAPVLQWIVRLAATLLGYINAIVQGWFGINLFSRGSAKNFQKMKAGASGVSKAVKEIKKQLAGFDEINMLTDQSDSGAGGGGGAGGAIPDFDLSAMQGEPPVWLQWIIDNKDLILAIMAGIAAGLLAWKLGLDGIKALGIGLLIAGIVYTIESLLEYLKDPSWENFGKIIQGIGVAIIGLGLLIGSVPVAVAGAIVLIVGTIIKYWEQIKSFLQGGIDWLKGKSEWVHQMFGNVIGSIYDYFVARFQAILNFANGWITSLKQVFDGFIKFFKGVFTGNWQLAFEGLKQIVSGFINNIINIFNYVMSFLRDRVALWGNVVGKAFGGAFKAVVNAVLRTIENTLNTPIRAINRLIDVINAVPGINLGKLTTFNLPRLKTGAIINMPNRGTLVGGGSAIAGEAGREGILPLDDRQAMAELGAEIGRHVLVNLTNITQMNGRVIGRELKQVQSEQEFAFNS